jgi:hypothetical protein
MRQPVWHMPPLPLCEHCDLFSWSCGHAAHSSPGSGDLPQRLLPAAAAARCCGQAALSPLRSAPAHSPSDHCPGLLRSPQCRFTGGEQRASGQSSAAFNWWFVGLSWAGQSRAGVTKPGGLDPDPRRGGLLAFIFFGAFWPAWQVLGGVGVGAGGLVAVGVAPRRAPTCALRRVVVLKRKMCATQKYTRRLK